MSLDGTAEMREHVRRVILPRSVTPAIVEAIDITTLVALEDYAKLIELGIGTQAAHTIALLLVGQAIRSISFPDSSGI